MSRNIIGRRKHGLTIHFCISIIMLLMCQLVDSEANNVLFLIYALWQIIVYLLLLFAELRYPGLNIISVMFAGLLMGIAYPSLSYSLDLLNGQKVFYAEAHDISDFIFQTSISLNIYFSLFVLLLTLFSKGKLFIIDIHRIAKRINLYFLSIVLYLGALVLRFFPVLEYVSSTLSSLANSVPMLVLLLLAVYCGLYPHKRNYYYLFLLLIVVEVLYTMLLGFYKGDVVRAIAMYAIYYYLYCRTQHKSLFSTKTLSLTFAFLLFILYIVYPFITLRRNESGFTSMSTVVDLNKVDNMEILSKVLTLDYEILEDDTESAFTERLSSIAPSSFFYKDAYNNGHHYDMIEHSILVMVPRFISPNKPKGSTGNMATNYYRYHSFDPECDAATSIGPFASSYFWGGWLGVLVMCLINAFVISSLMKVCFSNLQNLFSWLAIFYLIFAMLLCFKETADGGYNQDILFIVYIFIIIISSAYLKKKQLRVKHNN